MMVVPMAIFWILLLVGRDELGLKGVLFCLLLSIGFLVGFMAVGLSPYLFVAALSFIDAVLIVVMFGGDIRIR